MVRGRVVPEGQRPLCTWVLLLDVKDIVGLLLGLSGHRFFWCVHQVRGLAILREGANFAGGLFLLRIFDETKVVKVILRGPRQLGLAIDLLELLLLTHWLRLVIYLLDLLQLIHGDSLFLFFLLEQLSNDLAINHSLLQVNLVAGN